MIGIKKHNYLIVEQKGHLTHEGYKYSRANSTHQLHQMHSLLCDMGSRLSQRLQSLRLQDIRDALHARQKVLRSPLSEI